MALTKRNYTSHQTVITAENLNDIQDAIIEAESSIADLDEKKVDSEVLENSLSSKLDMLTTTGDKIYTHSGSAQGEKTVTTTPTAGAVPLYGTGGRLKASAPSANDDVLRKKEHDDLVKDIKAGTEATAAYHLGFYLDENGDLVQVD